MKKKPGQDQKVILFPRVKERLIEKGKDLIENKRYSEALQAFHEFTLLSTPTPEVRIAIVVCLLELGRYDEAKKKCKRLLETGEGDYFNILQLYITILLQISEYNEAVYTIETLLEEGKIPSQHLEHYYQLLEFSRKRVKPIESPEIQHEKKDYSMLIEEKDIMSKLKFIQTLGKEDVEDILPILKEFLENRKQDPMLKTILIQYLQDHSVNQEFVINKFDNKIEFNPSVLTGMFDHPFAKSVLAKLEDYLEQENPTLYTAIKQIWEQMLFIMYPVIPQPINERLWAGALLYVGYQMYGIPFSERVLAEEFELQTGEIEKIAAEIIKFQEHPFTSLN